MNNHIILDSNIIQYSTDKYASGEITAYQNEFSEKGFTFDVSEVSFFELLKGATTENEKAMLQKLFIFNSHSISDRILITAACLDTLYRIEGIEPKQIESEDKLIAAIALLTGSYILTANARDYPSPYFQEVERKPLIYPFRKDRSKCILVSLLMPDIVMINRRFSER